MVNNTQPWVESIRPYGCRISAENGPNLKYTRIFRDAGPWRPSRAIIPIGKQSNGFVLCQNSLKITSRLFTNPDQSGEIPRISDRLACLMPYFTNRSTRFVTQFRPMWRNHGIVASSSGNRGSERPRSGLHPPHSCGSPSVSEAGTQGRTRTGTPAKAGDFESPASTIPPLGPRRPD